jgi:hypothetical protein
MEGTSLLERLPFSKRNSVLISVFASLVVFAVLIVLIGTYAKSLPEVINQTFENKNASETFDTLGSGSWSVSGGTYQLAQPVVLTNVVAGHANASINKQAISANEWRLSTNAKATDVTNPDFSVIFDYADEANYYYANFSNKTDGKSNGIFKVVNGTQTALSAFPSTIQTGKDYVIEIRRDADRAKVYRDGEFLAGTKDVKAYASMRVGYGSRGSAVIFDNLILGAKGAVTNPTPTPSPETPGEGSGSEGSANPSTGTGDTTTPPVVTPTPGGRKVEVSSSAQLATAIADAQPGDVINLADGTYDTKTKSPLTVNGSAVYGGFVATKTGTVDKPIVVQGSRKAIISGDGIGGHYGVHLYKVNYWQLKGFTVATAKKGIMLDGSSYNVIDGVEVHAIHDEGIHLRAFSSDNVVRNSYIHDTGLTSKGLTNGYGEGLYVGTANSNWGVYTGGKVDKSDRNQLIGNKISNTAGEGIDIKEGTENGLVKDNLFDRAGISGSNFSDSWVDVKGNGWTLTGNKGTNAKLDGFQVHGNQLKANGNWGNNNTFTNNTADVNASGYGFWSQNNVSGNVFHCNNVVTRAGGGFGNVNVKATCN